MRGGNEFAQMDVMHCKVLRGVIGTEHGGKRPTSVQITIFYAGSASSSSGVFS